MDHPKILSTEEKNGFNSMQYVTPGLDMTKYVIGNFKEDIYTIFQRSFYNPKTMLAEVDVIFYACLVEFFNLCTESICFCN